MDLKDFRRHAHELVDWMADYLEHIEDYPVKSQVRPKDILKQLPEAAPESGEVFEQIFADFQQIILPGITHWQHPAFHAYFPANSSPPSVLAEMLTATIGAQCMIWQTSPAAAELEERMMEWLREMIGLPPSFSGVIQDTASTATLCAILTAREQFSSFSCNREGLRTGPRYRVYCSEQTHSSIDKAVRIAGLGDENLRKIAVDENFAMLPEALEAAIAADIRAGMQPLCVIATLGTTGSTAIDPLEAIGQICRRHGLWYHVDAALAGSALLLPEMRHLIRGAEMIDSFVFNPHKWLFTNFDCSAYFVQDPGALIRTFEILPEYLKTPEDQRVNNYRDWGIPLGRRFRALKLWFVIRSYGVEGLQARLRAHLALAREFAGKVEQSPDFELLAPVPFNTICFRYKPPQIDDEETLNRLNSALLENLNRSGKVFLTHTRLNDRYTIRMVLGQTRVERRHMEAAWEMIVREARGLDRKFIERG